MMLISAVTISVMINVITILMATAVPVEILPSVLLTHLPTVAENQFKRYLIGCYLIGETLNLAS